MIVTPRILKIPMQNANIAMPPVPIIIKIRRPALSIIEMLTIVIINWINISIKLEYKGQSPFIPILLKILVE
jgi:hypothetical protein